MTTQLTDLTVTQALDGLKNKDFSAVELAQACLDQIESLKHLNCFVAVTADEALAQAKKADEAYATGNARALEGIPMGFKDLFCTKGVRSQACSKMLDGFKPPYESTVTQNLRDDGVVMLGKLNMDEFAMGSSNELSVDGPAINPWKRADGKDLVPGGSSGASAAAVAARLCPASTGSETGGSVRQPAGLTGTVGFRPTYGRCSRWGMIAFASSLDQAGSLTHTVEDAALVMQSMAGFDPKDSTSVDTELPDLSATLGQDIKGMKIGLPKEYRMDRTPDEINTLWDKGAEMLKDAGAEPVEISLPHTKYALPVYFILAPAEASSNLARYDGVRYGHREDGENLNELYEKSRTAGFDEEVRHRIMIGTYVLSAGYYDAYYRKAQRVRNLIAQDFRVAFEKVDVMLTPATASTAFPVGEKSFAGEKQLDSEDPLGLYLEDIFAAPSSLAGLPGISVPISLSSDGLPLSLQLMAPALDEQTLLKAAHVLEKQAAFDARPQLLEKTA